MECTVSWTGAAGTRSGMGFVAETGSGHVLAMDGAPDAARPEMGGQNLAPRPMETVLAGTGGCTAYDVVLILRRGRHDVRGCSVKLTSERAEQDPKVFTAIHMHFIVTGLGVPASHTQRDWTQPYEASDAVEAAWLQVYRAPEQYWDLYQLGEKLTDLEDAFRLWRFRHVTTVERIIGFKRGTGGTGGVSYLRKMLDVVLFPELWRLRTDL